MKYNRFFFFFFHWFAFTFPQYLLEAASSMFYAFIPSYFFFFISLVFCFLFSLATQFWASILKYFQWLFYYASECFLCKVLFSHALCFIFCCCCTGIFCFTFILVRFIFSFCCHTFNGIALVKQKRKNKGEQNVATIIHDFSLPFVNDIFGCSIVSNVTNLWIGFKQFPLYLWFELRT